MVKNRKIIKHKPPGWDDKEDGPCGRLPVRVEDVHGARFAHLYSNWKPDAVELAYLNHGGVVELCCIGAQPPVSVHVVAEHKGD